MEMESRHRQDESARFILRTCRTRKTAKLNTEYAVIGPIYELLTTGTFTFTMRAPNTSGTSPADMTIQERQQNGILTIPRDQLQSVAAEMGVPDADVRALMSTDQDEFYFTSSAPECTIAENISSAIRNL